MAEAGQRQLGSTRATADGPLCFQHEYATASARQCDRRGQPIRTGPDHNRIITIRGRVHGGLLTFAQARIDQHRGDKGFVQRIEGDGVAKAAVQGDRTRILSHGPTH